MSGISDLYQEVATYGSQPPEWVEKMLHNVPAAPVFKREDYLIKATRNKVIMDLGASGPISEALSKVAKDYHGVDITASDLPNHYQLDLEQADELPEVDGLQIIVAGEIIEHLSNAGRFLDLLHRTGCQVILTTPNAHLNGNAAYAAKGMEAVNGEHVAWYSYHTLKTLVERHGFNILLWGWYNGKPMTAEGIIFHMEPVNGEH
jgi:hypothetical protein